MGASLTQKEKIYRAYMEFFDIAERKRRWHPFNDIPWENLDPSKNTEEKAISIELFCGIELYVPDYTASGLNLVRPFFGYAWFQTNWGYEESKHGLTFREYLIRSGMRTKEQYAEFEKQVFAHVWKPSFKTPRQMTCYGALQESATFLVYKDRLEKARKEGDEVLEKIYYYLSRDEGAHMGFYLKVLQFEMEEDREGTLADLAHIIYHFKMPTFEFIPEQDQRLGVVGISYRQFLQRGLFPILKALRTKRSELVMMMMQKKKVTEEIQVN
ncbi:acyl-ACP desaturase [Anabaena minutissima FACHB-250]|nr:acyl-ACP desaturase [Anabaena minutissima FACHB-250]